MDTIKSKSGHYLKKFLPPKKKKAECEPGVERNPVSKEVPVARTSVLILAPWNPLSLCAYGESHKEFK